LKRHFGREFRSKTEFEKISRLLPHRPVLRQIAASLPHKPYRWRAPTLMIENIEKRVIHRTIPSSPFL
jgi:hypothetical protein